MIVAKGLVSLVFYSDYLFKAWQSKRKARVTPRGSNIALTSSQTPGQTGDTRGGVSTSQGTMKPPHADAMLVGFAMIARGEIGFLIASLSQSSGTLNLKDPSGSGESIFLVIVWAVVLCTIIGPVAVGIIVRKQRGQAIDT